MTAVALTLLILAAALLVLGMGALVLAPIMAARLAATTTRPKLERRGSGPDRMRAIINAQMTERRKRTGLSTILTRLGVSLAIAAVVVLAAGLVSLWRGM